MDKQKRAELISLIGKRAVLMDGPNKGVYGVIKECEHHLTPVKIFNENLNAYPTIKWIGIRDIGRIEILS